MSSEAKDLVSKLLMKDKNNRLAITQALDHPWFVQGNESITRLRKEANISGDELMKFISYSNCDAKMA